MSISFLWISDLGFSESLRLYAGVFPVSFPGSGSVLDKDTWDVVFFIGEVCDSTSFLCLDSDIWVFV